MARWYTGAALLGAFAMAAGIGFRPAVADGAAAAARPAYVVNVKKAFEASPRFKAESETLKADMAKKEADLQEIQRKLKAANDTRGNMKNKADLDGIDKQINDLQFEFATKQRKYREELAKSEADLMASIYGEMSANLKKLCDENKILLVLRLDEPETAMPEDMKTMTLMSRQVVHYHPNLDLTAALAQMMGAGPVAAAPAAAERR